MANAKQHTDEHSGDGQSSDRYVFGGLLGLSIAIIVQILDKELVDRLRWAVYCFAVAIPILTSSFVLVVMKQPDTHYKLPGLRHFLGLIGVATAIVGLWFIFFSFGTNIGIVFTASFVLAIGAFILSRPS